MTGLRDRLQRTLGDACTIEREIGGGGMSRVFVATEKALGRQIVVKTLPTDSASSVSVERFKREIQVAARLQHPHIVPILSTGETDGIPFYTMPFVKGESLRERLAKSGELSVNDTIHILRNVAAALTIWAVPASGGPSRVAVTIDPAYPLGTTDWSTDGTRMFFVRGAVESDVSVMEMRKR